MLLDTKDLSFTKFWLNRFLPHIAITFSLLYAYGTLQMGLKMLEEYEKVKLDATNKHIKPLTDVTERVIKGDTQHVVPLFRLP